jgi:TatD DNase family protein
MLIDSHCHLDRLNLDHYQNDLSALIDQSKKIGVKAILSVSVDLEGIATILKIADTFPFVYASVGVHPSDVCEAPVKMEDLLPFMDHPKVIAVGETGLDYHYNKTGLDVMRDQFRLHIQLARLKNKPLIIHTREAHKDTINIMKEERASEVRGVMHCFTESFAMAVEAMELGFYISFSGIVTFSNAKNVVEVAKQVPLENMLIETDAPYLTPVPYRGKPNEPQYVYYVAQKIAEIKNVSYEEVIEKTGKNFCELFGVKVNAN